VALAAENLFLRKQVGLYRERQVKQRRASDPMRLGLVLLARCFAWCPSRRRERAGYAFTYTPATPEPDGRVSGYRVQARLVNPGWLQQKRFLMDQSGVIHVTEEDRDATPQDPRDPAGE
jgi:hypothetical protein